MVKPVKPLMVLSTPRTGSSAIGKLLSDSGIKQFEFGDFQKQAASEFNENGYFEDSTLNLCLDNLIRFTFGNRNSFIFNKGMFPNKEAMLTNLCTNWDSVYDLDTQSVSFPEHYSNRFEEFTGHSWDVWGLTRMNIGHKWHRAYSRAGVESGKKAYEKFISIMEKFEVQTNVFIKDPRLIYLLPLVDRDITAIIVRRNEENILKSMRNHYGPNLFTDNRLFEDWVSNHFNYAIQPQTFDEFYRTYHLFEDYAYNNFDVHFMNFEDLHNEKILVEMSKELQVSLQWKV
jgi:hypothetical protein